jgi:hypothetical protein
MKLHEERELLVLTNIDRQGSSSLEEIRSALELKDDPDFDFDSTLNHLVQEGYLEQSEDLSWKITSFGRSHLCDLQAKQNDDINKIPVIILGVLLVVAILAFIKLFPRMFP